MKKNYYKTNTKFVICQEFKKISKIKNIFFVLSGRKNQKNY